MILWYNAAQFHLRMHVWNYKKSVKQDENSVIILLFQDST